MSTDPAAMVKEGVRLYKANKKAEARSIWEQVTELDPYNEQAWLWLSAVVESVDDQRVCLENVLYINPDNPNAKKGLAALDAKNPSATGATSSRSSGTGTSPLTPSAPPIATSSASSSFVPETTPPEVYDDWIGSLNLPGTGNLDSSSRPPASSTSGGGTKKPATSPFTTTDFDGLDDFDSADSNIFDDISGESSFETYTPAPARPTGSSYSGGDDLRAMMAYDDDDDDMYSSAPSSSASSRGRTSAPAFGDYAESDDDDDVFGDDFSVYTPPAPASSSSRAQEYDLGDDPFSDDPFPNAAPTTAPSSSPFTSDDLDFDTAASAFGSSSSGYGIASADDDLDPSEYFAMIPESIKASSLPGSDEKYPLLLRLMFIALLLLNMGAIVLLVVQLAG